MVKLALLMDDTLKLGEGVKLGGAVVTFAEGVTAPTP